MSVFHEAKPLHIPKIRELNLTDIVFSEEVDPQVWEEIQYSLDYLSKYDRRSSHDSRPALMHIELALKNLGLGEYVEPQEHSKTWDWHLVAKEGFSFQTITTQISGEQKSGVLAVVKRLPLKK